MRPHVPRHRWYGTLVCVPDALRAALMALMDPRLRDAIEQTQVFEYSRFARLHGRAQATTRRRCIFLRGSAEAFFADAELVLHEYCHVVLQWEPGILTVGGYLWECLRRGYWNNRYEFEARAFAERQTAPFRALLAGRAGDLCALSTGGPFASPAIER